MSYEDLARAASEIRAVTGRQAHDVAVILGSGLSPYAQSLPGSVAIPYEKLPGFPITTVEGHAGTLISAELPEGTVIALAGRTHLYEGRPLPELVFGVRASILAGCRSVVLTNASGGVNTDFQPGDLVLITDHINLTGRNPLTGENDRRLGPRFPDMSRAYPVELREVAQIASEEADVPLKEGVYAWMTGPSYETPAEIRMIAKLGADLVGMSTVPEAIAATHMGAGVLGISLVTNAAAGISATPLSHEEVTQVADEARERFERLLDTLLPRLATL